MDTVHTIKDFFLICAILLNNWLIFIDNAAQRPWHDRRTAKAQVNMCIYTDDEDIRNKQKFGIQQFLT